MNEILSHWLSNKILTTNLKKSPTPSFIVLWIPKAKNQTEFRLKISFSYRHHLKKFVIKFFFCYIFLVYQTIFAYLVPNSSPSLVLWSYNFKKAFLNKNSLSIYSLQRWCPDHIWLNSKRHYFSSEIQILLIRVSELIKMNILSYHVLKSVNKQKNGRQTHFS